MQYHASVEYINKARAEQLLEHNYENNRRVREAYVSQLTEVMKQGRFISENGQTIVVGEDDGVLYDGQHRLLAIANADTGYNFIVAYITEGKEKFKTIDANTPRGAADFISLPNKNDCAALAKIMAAVEWGSAPLLSCLQGRWNAHVNVDRGMTVLYCDQNSESVLNTVRQARRMRESMNCGAVKAYSVFLALIKLFMPNELELVDCFVDDFQSLAPSNKTVIACRNVISKAHMNVRSTPDLKWMLGTLTDAYCHYRATDNSTMLNKQQVRLDWLQKLLEAKRNNEQKG